MSDIEKLRDTFAAAALTGLLAGRLDRVEESQADAWANMAGLFADAMLRERGATNHDAAPAARAAELARSPGQSPRGTGDTTREPVAWLVLDERREPLVVHLWKAPAVRDAINHNGIIVPLYRDPPQPTLSDAEREAVVAADSELSAIGHHRTPDKRECLRISNLLRALLARLGGDE